MCNDETFYLKQFTSFFSNLKRLNKTNVSIKLACWKLNRKNSLKVNYDKLHNWGY